MRRAIAPGSALFIGRSELERESDRPRLTGSPESYSEDRPRGVKARVPEVLWPMPPAATSVYDARSWSCDTIGMQLPFAEPPASLCIVRLSAIGDTCHTVPVVRAIQDACTG